MEFLGSTGEVGFSAKVRVTLPAAVGLPLASMGRVSTTPPIRAPPI